RSVAAAGLACGNAYRPACFRRIELLSSPRHRFAGGLAMTPKSQSRIWGKDSRTPAPGAADAELIGGGEDGRERLAFFLGAGPGFGNVLRPLPYFGSALAVLLALAVGILIERFIGLQSVLLVFLMAILASAILWGLLPSLLACVLSVLAFNFFLVPPVYTFDIADPENAVALFFFLVVAVIVSNLTALARSQLVIARARAKTTAALYAFSRKLAGIGALDDLLWATAYQVSSMLNVRTVVLTSISHDLRTPLASILGTVSGLRSFPEKYDAAQREELLATLQEEAERLNRFVANLLDMTRLESGALELKLELSDIGEIV